MWEENDKQDSGRCQEKILEVEKNCKFETTIAAELLASKILSLIGKSTGEYELRRIRKNDMSVEAITEAYTSRSMKTWMTPSETEEEKQSTCGEAKTQP